MQNDLSAAQSHLERACPLMELLPPNLLSDEDFAAAAGEALEDSGLRLLDPTDLTSYLWMGTGTGSGPGQRQGQGHGAAQGGSSSTDGSTKSNSYAAGCYSLLRDVYAKIYGENDSNKNREIAPVDSTESPTALATKAAGSTNGHIPSPREFPVSTTTLKYSPHQAGYHSFVLPNGKPREFNLKYLLSKRQQRQQMKARALYSRYNSSSRDTSSGSSGSTSTNPTPLTGANARSTKVSGAKLSMAGATAGTAFLEKSLSAAAAAQQQQQQQQQQQGEGGEMEAGHRRRNHALLLGVDGEGLYDDGSVDTNTPAVAAAVTSAATSTSTNAHRTSVFSEADEEEEQVELTPPAAMPAIASDSELGADIAGADSRKPSPLRNDVNPVHAHARGQVPQPRNFDFEQKLQDLRSPYEHLRSELQLVQDLQNQNNNLKNNKNNKNNKNKKTKQSQPSSKRSGTAAEPQAATTESDYPNSFSADGDDDAEFTGGSSSGGRRVGLGLSTSPSVAGPKRSNKAPQPVVRGFEGSSLNHISGEDITAPGVSTSIIADDLETLLRKFVQANVRNKKELLLQARKYYDELDINFPNVSHDCPFFHLKASSDEVLLLLCELTYITT